MEYIIIERFPLGLVTDEEGNPKVFDSEEEANKEAENCQFPIIVNIEHYGI